MGVQQVVSKWLEKVFGSRNARLLKRFGLEADAAEALEEQIRGLSDDALRDKTAEFKSRIAAGEDPAEVMSEAFAVLREASRRAQSHRHFHCQLIGGKVLYGAMVAEMRTGEGKTIVCHLAAYMRVVRGQKVHVVTVNDYLVKRDAEFAKPIDEVIIRVAVHHVGLADVRAVISAHRVLDAVLFNDLRHLLDLARMADTDDDKAIVCVLLHQFIRVRDRSNARPAPCRPEVKQDNLSKGVVAAEFVGLFDIQPRVGVESRRLLCLGELRKHSTLFF